MLILIIYIFIFKIDLFITLKPKIFLILEHISDANESRPNEILLLVSSYHLIDCDLKHLHSINLPHLLTHYKNLTKLFQDLMNNINKEKLHMIFKEIK